MDKIAIYKEIIIKEASDKQEKRRKAKDKVKNVAKSTVMGGTGTGMLYLSKDRLLGQKTLYHGTGDEAWNDIKKEGLKASKGGKGGAVMAPIHPSKYIEESKGKVHVTSVKSKAHTYKRDTLYNNLANDMRKEWKAAGSPGDGPDYQKIVRQIYRKDGKHRNSGKVLKIKMNYDKYKNNFEIDPNDKDAIKYMNKNKFNDIIAKHQAARGKVDIGKDEIVGLHKTSKRLKNQMKYLPKYIKNNKARFGTGVALAGTGGALLGNAIKANKKGE